jgi:hypothetical protein
MSNHIDVGAQEEKDQENQILAPTAKVRQENYPQNLNVRWT